MKKDFLKRSVIIPLITALVVGIVLTAALFGGYDRLFPFADGSKLASFDAVQPPQQPVKVENGDLDMAALQKNDLVGALQSGDDSLWLRFDADASCLSDSASLCRESNSLREPGCVYIRLGTNNHSLINEKKPLMLSGQFGEMGYAFEDSFTVSSEAEVFRHSVRGVRSLVIFWHLPSDAGIKSACQVMVFKGVL